VDEYRIDQHKLIYHPDRVSRWLSGENIFPLYIEIGLASRCQHRCIFCAFDYTEYKGPFLETEILKKTLADAASHDVKSVMFAGEGEPLLHKDIGQLVNFTSDIGLNVAITTNGVLFDEQLAHECLPFLSWIRFSMDAAYEGTYRRIHRCPAGHFQKVKENIATAVKIKTARGYGCTVGAQALLLQENADEFVELAYLARSLGADYFTVKPFSKHPLSLCDFDFDYSMRSSLDEKLKQVATDHFQIIFRSHTMDKLAETERPYKECLGLPFWTYIDSKGDVYACSAFLGNQDFVYGNIYQNSFSQIWEGQRRKEVLKRASEMSVDPCREVCRLDEINRYLWALTHRETVPHINFI